MNTHQTFTTGAGVEARYCSIPSLRDQGFPHIDRLPVSIRIVLESLLRNYDGKKVTEADIRNLAGWRATAPGSFEVPFTVARVVLQDFTGVPLVVDLAAMRDAAAAAGADPAVIEPLVPVDLVIDHSVQVDFAGSQQALTRNLQIEFIRNQERYAFLKWGQQAFQTFNVIPPGIGIVHQVNLEHLAKGVLSKNTLSGNLKSEIYYFDTLVGTDSHTTMINGLGVVGWGVGGIEAEAAMLGQPVTFLVPEVVGVHMHGKLNEGVTATDLTLRITEILRAYGVVGKFVEFFGAGARALSLPDRATIANMAPEYGATMGFFPVDSESVAYLRGTGRSDELCQTVENYFKAQEMWGIPEKGQIDYSETIDLDLTTIVPAVAGPKRPQDRIDLPELGNQFNKLFSASTAEGGFGRDPHTRSTTVSIHMPEPAGVAIGSLLDNPSLGCEMDKAEMTNNRPTPDPVDAAEAFQPINTQLQHGSVLIAAITSCTNTSNPSVMLAAGLLAKKANALGLTVPPYVKTSLGPGSRVVTDYLNQTKLQQELDQLGFQTVGYGCTTCIGNSGPLHPAIESGIKEGNLVCASVLSGNRNFEARVHGSIRANFLMSPPLVVAYALAGLVDIDLTHDPIGTGKDGQLVYLKDIWPSNDELKQVIVAAIVPEVFHRLYRNLDVANQNWVDIPSTAGHVYTWEKNSTYIQKPPFFEGFSRTSAGSAKDIMQARALAILGDSVTTDHISPAGSIVPSSPAGQYLLAHGVEPASFNSFGSRRGNDQVMTRGTFANVRIKNTMCADVEGGYTQYYGPSEIPAPDKEIASIAGGKPAFIFDAAQGYKADGTDLIIIGGEDYGMGSSRDWAAKGTRLLGVSAVITKSFERIHRSNLVGMGILPLNFKNPADYERVITCPDAHFSITGLTGGLTPAQDATLIVSKSCGESFQIPLIVRIDTPAEVDYYLSGGILPYVLNQILSGDSALT